MKNVTFIARLRAPNTPIPQKGKLIKSFSKSRIKSPGSSNSKKTSKNSASQSKSPTLKPKTALNQNLNENIKYSIFTSTPPSNLLCISSKPINGKTISDTFKTKNDLYEFSQTILKETSLLEYDSIYNETSSQEKIYTEQIKNKITNLFHGQSSCVLLYGPHGSGKSYLLRGNTDKLMANSSSNENGLLLKAINDIFNLLSLTRQAQNDFTLKISSYQIFMEKVNDLLCNEVNKSTIKVDKYFDKHQMKCELVGLNKVNIGNKGDFDTCLKEILHQRKNLTGAMKIDDLKRKSHFVISLMLEKRKYINNYSNEIELYSQIDFVELASSDYGFMGENEEDKSQESFIYKNIGKSLNSLCDLIVSTDSNLSMKNETKLSLCLRNTIIPGNKVVFINCIIPYEYPIGESYKAIKFTNWLRNQVMNIEGNRDYNRMYQNENQEEQQYGEETIPSGSNCEYDKNIQYYNENNINNQNNGTFYNERNGFQNRIGLPQNDNMQQNLNNNNNTNVIDNSLNMNDYNAGVDDIRNRMNQRSKQQKHFNTLDSENKNISSIAKNPTDNYPQFIANKNINPMIDNNNIPNNNNINQYKLTQSNDISFDPSFIANNPKHARQFQNISQSLNQMNNKSLALANTNLVDSFKKEQPQLQLSNPTSSPEIERIKSEYATMKSDNIIFKEDITRLTNAKQLLENELQLQRNRNIELTSANEQLQSQLKAMELKYNEIDTKLQIGSLIEIDPNKKPSDNLYDMLNARLSFETKLRDVSTELNNVQQTKQQLEIDYRVLQERFDNLQQDYKQILNENNCIKCNYNSQINNIEDKIAVLLKEIEKLQDENLQLRSREETLIKSNNEKDIEKEKYRMMYEQEQDNNSSLQKRLCEIEREFNKVIKEKENEQYLKMKEDEFKQRKNESKIQFINSLQNKLAELKSERLKKKQQEDYY